VSKRGEGGGGGFGKKSENKNMSTREEERKRNHQFLDPAYIYRLTDEYRRARTVRVRPLYSTISPTNVRHVYSSMT
jgi:hypothetical protein